MKPASLKLLSIPISIGIAMLFCLEPVVAADSSRFEKDVLPILYQHCFACHSEKQAEPKGNLCLDAAEAILESGVIV